MPTSPAAGSLKPPPRVTVGLLTVAAAVVAGIIALSVISVRDYAGIVREEAARTLMSVAKNKSEAVRDWRNERLGDGAFLFHNPYVFRSFQESMTRPASPEFGEMRDLLDALRISLDYRQILFRAADLSLVFSAPDSLDQFGKEHRDHAAEALRSEKIILSDIYRDGASGEILMDVCVPVFRRKSEGGGAFGVFIFQADPRRYLIPMVQSWPSASPTAEALLVRREGDEVVFLSDLRHERDTALSLRAPLLEPRLPAAMAARGMEGLVAGKDYRGIEVMAVIRAVPGSPWFIVAKIDAKEIFATVRQRGWTTALLALVLIATAALGVRLFQRDQRLRFYRQQYKAELDRNFLSRRYEAITRYANDIIILFEDNGKIIEVNENALKAYGYDLEEITGKNIRDLRDPRTRDEVSDTLQRVRMEGNARYETIHVRKDGTPFPVEISISAFNLQGKDYFLALYRDISARLEAERALKESELKFRTLFNESGDAIFIHDFEGRSLEFNQAAIDRLGYSPEELRRITPMDWDAPEFKDNFKLRAEEIMKTGSVRFETVHMTKSGARIPVEVISRVISYRGRPAILATVRDISIRKQAEEALKKALAEKEILLREINHRVKNNMQVISSLLNLQAGRISDPGARRALQDSRERVQTMALIHEKLYRAADFAHIDFAEYLQGVAAQIMKSYQGESDRIRLETKIATVPVDLDQAIPCGLIVNELVSNAMKHAFPEGASGTVRIEFGPDENGDLALAVANDGAPLPADFDIRRAKSLGMQIVAMLAEQLGGTIAILKEEGVGFRITLGAE